MPVIVRACPGASVAGAIEAIVGGDDPAGAATVTTAVALTPSHTAVMVVVPGLSALTRPSPSMVATIGAVEVHVTRRPSSGAPFLSLTTMLDRRRLSRHHRIRRRGDRHRGDGWRGHGHLRRSRLSLDRRADDRRSGTDSR